MLKQSAQLEVKIGERVYQFNLPSDSPLGEVHDALYQMRSYIVDRIMEANKADQPQVIDPVEEVTEEKEG